MDDCVEAVRPAIKTALLTKNAKLYVNQRYDDNGTVKIPHGFVWSSTESRGVVYGRAEDTITLQLYANSIYELGELENVVEFLDDHRPASYGKAASPHWSLQSKTRIPEGNGKWQSSLLFSVRYSDVRKWEAG